MTDRSGVLRSINRIRKTKNFSQTRTRFLEDELIVENPDPSYLGGFVHFSVGDIHLYKSMFHKCPKYHTLMVRSQKKPEKLEIFDQMKG